MSKIETTLTIDEEHFPKLVMGVFKEHPMPLVPVLDEDGNEVIEDGEVVTTAKYTNIEWIKLVAMQYLMRECKEGLRRLAIEATSIDNSIVEDIITDNLG